MTNEQKIYVGIAILALLGMFFGLDTKPSEQKIIEKSRANNFETIDVNSLIANAKETLSEGDRQYLTSLERIAGKADQDSAKLQVLEQLAGDWYRKGFKEISGFYAGKIAELTNTEEAWAITGSTYAAAINAGQLEPKVEEFAFNKAVQAFENAYSLNPNDLNHRINLAIMYAEHPIESNPMKGIQMLLEMNRQNPENTVLLYHLARLGMQTGQYEKAIGRIEKSLAIEPNEKRMVCLAADAYKALNNQEKYVQYNALCNTLN